MRFVVALLVGPVVLAVACTLLDNRVAVPAPVGSDAPVAREGG